VNQPVSEAHGSQRAQGTERDTARLLAEALGEAVEVSLDAHGIPCARVPRELWTTAARFVRDDLGLDFFDWLSAVDQSDADPAGLDVVVHVADSGSAHRGAADPPDDVVVRRMLLMTRAPQDDLTLESLTSVWLGAAWHERETYEMFGLSFTDFHEATGLGLRPLLLPDGFEGNPLLKSFQLASRAVRPWPGAGEPGESGQGAASRRSKVQAPGVPDPDAWGPREAGPVAADVPGEDSGD
jgi:NADH-quinone oxidoreductase subunit C